MEAEEEPHAGGAAASTKGKVPFGGVASTFQSGRANTVRVCVRGA